MVRKGSNPAKAKKIDVHAAYHRVIVPIHIPDSVHDYFKESFEVLKLSLTSLVATIHEKTRISLISDSSCEEVVEFLRGFRDSNSQIDQLFESRTNIGKVNALNAAIKSNVEPLVTLADADILFLPGWQSAVENIFLSYEQAGVVSPVPISGREVAFSIHASTTFLYGLMHGLSGRLVGDKVALTKYWESLGRQEDLAGFNDEVVVLDGRDVKAVIGCGHFLITIRSEVFEQAPNKPWKSFALGSSVSAYFDKPNNDAGLLRLATTGNFAFHMGNRVEGWMRLELAKLQESAFKEDHVDPKDFPQLKPMAKPFVFVGKILNRILKTNPTVRAMLLRRIGISGSNF